RMHLARELQPFAVESELVDRRGAKEMVAFAEGALIQRKEQIARRPAIAVGASLPITIKMIVQIIKPPVERDDHPVDISLRELALPTMNHVPQHNGSL